MKPLGRQARPASCLGHPDRLVCRILPCKPPAKCCARTQFELTHHRPSLPEARCTQWEFCVACHISAIALPVIVPRGMSPPLTKPRDTTRSSVAKIRFVDLAQATPHSNAVNISLLQRACAYQ